MEHGGTCLPSQYPVFRRPRDEDQKLQATLGYIIKFGLTKPGKDEEIHARFPSSSLGKESKIQSPLS